jgi:hypothetical protein
MLAKIVRPIVPERSDRLRIEKHSELLPRLNNFLQKRIDDSDRRGTATDVHLVADQQRSTEVVAAP